MLPEVAAYLLVAIAGRVLSKALVREKIMSNRFKRVLKDAFFLLGGSIILIIIAGILEILISKQLVFNNACTHSKYYIISLAVLIVIIGIVLEFHRKKHISKSDYMQNL